MDNANLVQDLKSLIRDTKSLLLSEEKDTAYFLSSHEKELLASLKDFSSSNIFQPAQPSQKAFPPPIQKTAPILYQENRQTPPPKPIEQKPQVFQVPKSLLEIKQPSAPEKIQVSAPLPDPIKKTSVETKPVSSFKQDKPVVIEREAFGLKELMGKIAPQIRLIDTPPTDKEAKLLAQNWKLKKTAAPITIMIHHENAVEQRFLLNIAKAIDAHFEEECRVVNVKDLEKDNLWTNFFQTASLSLIIAQDATIWNLSHLKKLYHSIPSRSEHFIEKTPLFLLPALSLYLKQPGLKKSLWHALCKKIYESLNE